MIAFLIWYEGRWGSFKTAAAIVVAILSSLSLSVFFFGPIVTLAWAGLLEACGWWSLDPWNANPIANKQTSSHRVEILQPIRAKLDQKTGPLTALSCLILVVLIAAFYVADAYTSCRQEHGPHYECLPGGNRLVR